MEELRSVKKNVRDRVMTKILHGIKGRGML